MKKVLILVLALLGRKEFQYATKADLKEVIHADGGAGLCMHASFSMWGLCNALPGWDNP